MASASLTLPAGSRSQRALLEVLCLGVGLAVTLALFTAMAFFQHGRAEPQAEIEDVAMAAPAFVPPPPKLEQPKVTEDQPPVTGIEIAAAESPVHIAVVPPDLEKIIPPSDLPPKATIQFNQLFTDFKPNAGSMGTEERIYQQNEVDQAPVAVTKTIAHVTSRVRDNASTLRTTLLLVVDTEGHVTNIRVIRPSGNPKFDSIVLECVRDEWEFSPAIKKGKRVKCMVQQLVWYKWTESKFTL